MIREEHIEELIPSSNYGSREGEEPRLIVIHSTRSGKLWTPDEELHSTMNWFRNPASQRSAHFIVGYEGEWIYCVPWDKEAYHAEELNSYSIGLEFVQPTPVYEYSDIQIRRGAEATIWLCGLFDIPKRRLASDFGIVSGIVGHESTDQGQGDGKSDPGDLFPWAKFMRLVQGNPVITLGEPDTSGIETAWARINKAIAVLEGRE